MDAILQMRPSMKYLDEADVKKKNSRKVIEDEDMVDVENDDEEEENEEKPQLVALKVCDVCELVHKTLHVRLFT